MADNNKLTVDKYSNISYEYSALMTALRVSVSKHLLDKHFTVIWANDYYYKIIGYTKEEYEEKYKNHCDLYFADDKKDMDIITQAVTKALEEGKPGYECVCKMPVKNGSYIWTKIFGTFTTDSVSGTRVVYTIFSDISDLMRTKIEQTVTYDNLPGFIAKFKIGEKLGSFEFIDSNTRFVRFFGERKPEDGSYSIVNHDNERNRRAILENYSAMREGKPVRFVVQLKTSEGHDAWFQVNAECVEWIKNDPVYLLVYIDITDITELRELQKKLEERTEMLRNTLEIAEKANRAKSDFLSRMSHDIRTPMNAIIGMTAIARDNLQDKTKVKDCLNKIETSTKFLLSLINDILDMSKIESGKMVLKKKEIDFPSFIANIASMFYPQAEKKKIRFNVSADHDLKETYIGDELKLNQIIINLLSNAIKFTDSGGTVKLTITPGKLSKKSSELIFTVEDSGLGMDKSFIDKVFLPFEQDTAQKENRGGTGLGLAIAGNYARMMNGFIDVESEQGKGSKFTVSIWLDLEDSQKASQTASFFADKKALMISGDKNACKHASGLFAQFGVTACCSCSEKETFMFLREAEQNGRPFDIVIIDADSFNGGAEHTISAIKDFYGKNRPIIAAAAYDRSVIKYGNGEDDALFFLQKPVFSSNIYDFLISIEGRGNHKILQEKGQSFNGEQILLAEDNDINLEIAQELLESRNLKVEVARNGREAVDIFKKAEPGHYLAILMDIQMPIMNGLEATRQIRQLNKADAKIVPIIAMSANAFEDDVEKSIEAGMNGHISKPVDIASLFEVLKNINKE